MKYVKTFEAFVADKQVSEASTEGHETHKGLRFKVLHEPPHGYYVKGEDTESKGIFDKVKPQYFDKYDDAKEHGQQEIEGYLDEDAGGCAGTGGGTSGGSGSAVGVAGGNGSGDMAVPATKPTQMFDNVNTTNESSQGLRALAKIRPGDKIKYTGHPKNGFETGKEYEVKSAKSDDKFQPSIIIMLGKNAKTPGKTLSINKPEDIGINEAFNFKETKHVNTFEEHIAAKKLEEDTNQADKTKDSDEKKNSNYIKTFEEWVSMSVTGKEPKNENPVPAQEEPDAKTTPSPEDDARPNVEVPKELEEKK